MLINNKPGRATYLLSKRVSVIDLALFTAELGPLTFEKFLKNTPTLSNHKLIVLR